MSVSKIITAAILTPILLLASAALASAEAPLPGAARDFHGFPSHCFMLDGLYVNVTCPRNVLPGRPWVWRYSFTDFAGPATDQTVRADLAMLERGLYLVSMPLGNEMGCPDALKHWDVLYREMVDKYGLSNRPAMEGLSREGLSIYRWASAHPTCVSCLYLDAPVCDFKSWPGGKGKGPGSPGDWKHLLTAYHFASESAALAWEKNPIDVLEPLAKAGVPLLHVVGDSDRTVPIAENTGIVKERYEKLGGSITVIAKKGGDHHPHGLEDPSPIVDFIVQHASAMSTLTTTSAPTGDPASAGMIALSAPLSRQVVQRDGENRAAIPILGAAPATATSIEAQAELDPDATRGRAVAWTVVADKSGIAAGRFQGKLSLEAGGWYTISIRAKAKDKDNIEKILATAKVEKIGVGDVYITAGQSNSANLGSVRQKAADSRVVYFDGDKFVPAADPMPGAMGSGGSPWPILGDMLVRTTQVPVCFRSVSIHWAPVRQWLPGHSPPDFPYYRTLTDRARWFGPHGVRAVLWHQGEDDAKAGTPAEDYARDLGIVIESMRKDLGYHVDWFVADAVSYSRAGGIKLNAVRGQKLVCSRGVAFRGPDTDDLGPPYRRADDGGHFNPLGLQTHAERWFAVLCRQYDLANPVSSSIEVKP